MSEGIKRIVLLAVSIVTIIILVFIPSPMDAIRSYFFGYDGEIKEVTYVSERFEDKITGSMIAEEGVNYSYKGVLSFTIECRGEISAAYLVYGKDTDEITTGDINLCNVEKDESGSYIINQDINILSERTEGYRKVYLLIKGGTGKNTIYCVAFSLSTIKVFYEVEVAFNEEGDMLYSIKPYENKDISETMEYEIKSEKEIQSMVVDQAGSYIARNKSEILQNISKIKEMSLE